MTVDDVVAFVRAAAPCRVEPTKVGVVFRNERRIVGSAKQGRDGVRGHLVLPRALAGDARFTRAEPLTSTLRFNGLLLDDPAQLDASFRALLAEASAV